MKTSKTNVGVEMLRVVAAVSIVLFHSPRLPNQGWFLSGLAIFLVLTGYFAARSASKRTMREQLERRVKSLIIPYFIWYVFYFTILLMISDGRLKDVHWFTWVFSGPFIHLWYLPAAFLGSVAIHAASRSARHIRKSVVMTIVIILIATSIYLSRSTSMFAVVAPIGQWIYSIPCLLIGLMFGVSSSISNRLVLAAQIGVAGSLVVAAFLWPSVHLVSYAIAAVCVLIALSVKWPRMDKIVFVSSLTFGIYILHPFAFLIVWDAYPLSPWPVFVGFALCFSGAVTLVLKRVPYAEIAMGRLAVGKQ